MEENKNNKIRFYVTATLSPNISETPEKYLICKDVAIARTGEYIYHKDEIPIEIESGPDGMIRVQRDPEVVFDQDTISSFNGKSICIEHPQNFVGPDNWQDLTVGIIQNTRRGEGSDSDLLLADLLITDEKAISLVRAGLRELSAGYDAEYEQVSPGVGKQIGIIGNHVALVQNGRAGKRCSIQDKKCNDCGTCNCKNNLEENNNEQGGRKVMKKGLSQKLSRIKKWFDDFPEEELDKKKVEPNLEAIAGAVEEIAQKVDCLAKGECKEIEDDDEEEKNEEKEPVSKDGKLEALEEKLVQLEKLVKVLLSHHEEKAEEKAIDAEEKEEEGEYKGEEEGEEGEYRGEEEGEGEEEKWADVASKAEILSPGLSLKKPEKDIRKAMDSLKRTALKSALKNEKIKSIISPLIKTIDFSKLTKDSIDTTFIAAAALVATKNNEKVHAGYVTTHDHRVANEIAEINRKNKEFYKKH